MKHCSVALAAYNGEKYIREQMVSILSQLNQGDELVVSINPGSDHTEDIVRNMAAKDERIHVYTCHTPGVLANFDSALSHCHNDIIFLSDQDDVWMNDKVSTVMPCFDDPKVILAEHDCVDTDETLTRNLGSLFARRHPGRGIMRNLIYNGYQGSCMAFRRELLDTALPLPGDIAMHDQWIGLLAEHEGKVIFLKKKLIFYRRHDDARTGERLPLPKKNAYMKIMLRHYQERIRRK